MYFTGKVPGCFFRHEISDLFSQGKLCSLPHLEAGVRVSDLRLGGSGKEEVEGHGEEGEVADEGVVLPEEDVTLDCVREHHPVLGQRHLGRRRGEGGGGEGGGEGRGRVRGRGVRGVGARERGRGEGEW